MDVGFKLFVDLFEFKLGVLWCFVLKFDKRDEVRDSVFFNIVESFSCLFFIIDFLLDSWLNLGN